MQSSFLQSFEWEQLQNSLGRKTRRIGGALLICHDLPFGKNYLYSPRPGFENESGLNKFLEEAERIAKTEKSIFLKIEPQQAFSIHPKTRGLGSIEHSAFSISGNLQPRKTLVVDLVETEERILSGMHPKARYNIRVSGKHGVTVRKGGGNECPAFFDMLKQTAKRGGFWIHRLDHYRKLLDIRTENFWNELFFAEHQGKKIAVALVNFYRPSGVVTYLHGASFREHKEMMAPHLLHWEMIRTAKRGGFRAYDFWGIDEEKWPGMTRFKTGFGGTVVEYPKATDVVFRQAWYQIYCLIKGAKRNMI